MQNQPTNPLEHSDSKNKPLKIVISIFKQEFWKKIRIANQISANKDLNEIIYNNRKNKSKYKNLTPENIKITKYIYLSEIIEFLKAYDLPENIVNQF